jgi:hypothetical protein
LFHDDVLDLFHALTGIHLDGERGKEREFHRKKQQEEDKRKHPEKSGERAEDLSVSHVNESSSSSTEESETNHIHKRTTGGCLLEEGESSQNPNREEDLQRLCTTLADTAERTSDRNISNAEPESSSRSESQTEPALSHFSIDPDQLGTAVYIILSSGDCLVRSVKLLRVKSQMEEEGIPALSASATAMYVGLGISALHSFSPKSHGALHMCWWAVFVSSGISAIVCEICFKRIGVFQQGGILRFGLFQRLVTTVAFGKYIGYGSSLFTSLILYAASLFCIFKKMSPFRPFEGWSYLRGPISWLLELCVVLFITLLIYLFSALGFIVFSPALLAVSGMLSFWLMLIPGSSCFPESGIPISDLDQAASLVAAVTIPVLRTVLWDLRRGRRSQVKHMLAILRGSRMQWAAEVQQEEMERGELAGHPQPG